jgi:glycosyltransferase involved in cell wall biosynthesis
VTEAECGLTVAPENPRAMADAIVELCNRSPAERRDMGAKGQAYVMERHSTPVLAGRLLEVIATASSAGTLQGHSGDDQVLIRSD